MFILIPTSPISFQAPPVQGSPAQAPPAQGSPAGGTDSGNNLRFFNLTRNLTRMRPDENTNASAPQPTTQGASAASDGSENKGAKETLLLLLALIALLQGKGADKPNTVGPRAEGQRENRSNNNMLQEFVSIISGNRTNNGRGGEQPRGPGPAPAGPPEASTPEAPAAPAGSPEASTPEAPAAPVGTPATPTPPPDAV